MIGVPGATITSRSADGDAPALSVCVTASNVARRGYSFRSRINDVDRSSASDAVRAPAPFERFERGDREHDRRSARNRDTTAAIEHVPADHGVDLLAGAVAARRNGLLDGRLERLFRRQGGDRRPSREHRQLRPTRWCRLHRRRRWRYPIASPACRAGQQPAMRELTNADVTRNFVQCIARHFGLWRYDALTVSARHFTHPSPQRVKMDVRLLGERCLAIRPCCARRRRSAGANAARACPSRCERGSSPCRSRCESAARSPCCSSPRR